MLSNCIVFMVETSRCLDSLASVDFVLCAGDDVCIDPSQNRNQSMYDTDSLWSQSVVWRVCQMIDVCRKCWNNMRCVYCVNLGRPACQPCFASDDIWCWPRYVFLSVSLSVYLFVCLSSVYVFLCLSVSLSLYVSVCQLICFCDNNIKIFLSLCALLLQTPAIYELL